MAKSNPVAAALSAALAAACCLPGCATTSCGLKDNETAHLSITGGPRDGVLIHIKSGPDNAHAAVMGLRMAQIMATDRDVLVYCDVAAIALVTNDGPNLTIDPMGSSHDILTDLHRHGVTVLACPGCMAVAGKAPGDLREGVEVADKARFFTFTKGRILTLDY